MAICVKKCTTESVSVESVPVQLVLFVAAQYEIADDHIHTGKCKSTGASCNALVQIKLRSGVRLKWRKR